MKVLLVDDHAVVREGLRRILADALPELCFGEACDTEQALAAVAEQGWDLILLDVSLPGGSGLDVLRELRQRGERVPVLVFSLHAEEDFAIRAFRAGASGYVTKDRPPEELLAAVRRVLAGRRWVSDATAEVLAASLSEPSREPHESLSARESEVFRLLVAGKALKEIAGALGISEKTASTYRARLLEKMKMGSTADLVRYAVRMRLWE